MLPMKNTFIYFVSIVILSSTFLKAQSLTSSFNTIGSSNDMMGGSLVVFCKDGIIENLSIGTADAVSSTPISSDTKYRIASISKTITAIAIMQLVEQNQLGLDDNISNILGYEVLNPNYPNIPITVRMLLSHTSSIIDGTTYSSFLNATVNQNPIPNLSEILVPNGTYYTSGQFTNTVPGNYFNYSNINYVVLGTIVEKVSNLRFDQYCFQNISNPLALDASFNVNDLQDINQVAVLYRKPGGVWTPQIDDYQGVQPTFANLDNYVPGTNGGRFGPQGGFRSSAQDIAKIFLALVNDGTYQNQNILTPASCNLMFSNQWTYSGNNGNNYFGLFRSWGLGIHRLTYTPGNDIALPGSTSMMGHTGLAYGLVSDAYFDQDRNVGFVFMTNGVGTGFQSNSQSSYYTIEQDVFNAIEQYTDIDSCNENLDSKEYTKQGVLIYPNPSGDFITIKNENLEAFNSIKLYALTGKLIKEVKVEDQLTMINVQDVKPGTYILNIDDSVHKIVKE